jgi:hypothetical protein
MEKPVTFVTILLVNKFHELPLGVVVTGRRADESTIFIDRMAGASRREGRRASAEGCRRCGA